MLRKWKWWWAWQDREHEAWLAEQSRQGFHLRRVAVLGVLHYFEQGAPAEMAYRWDFRLRGGSEDYHQLFRDAGWELVGDVGGSWLCWCKAAGEGQQPEIFTDRSSLLAKYRSLLLVLLPGLSVAPIILFDRGLWRDMLAGGNSGLAAAGVFGLGVFSLALTSVATLGVWRRMKEA
jgi:hypothetical protein